MVDENTNEEADIEVEEMFMLFIATVTSISAVVRKNVQGKLFLKGLESSEDNASLNIQMKFDNKVDEPYLTLEDTTAVNFCENMAKFSKQYNLTGE